MEPFAAEHNNKPCLEVKNGVISGINNSFIGLSGYSPKELLEKPLEHIWSNVLRITVAKDFVEAYTDAFIFTRQLEPVCINISRQHTSGGSIVKYFMTEVSDSLLNKELPFIDILYSKGKSGVAIYSIPELILLKANQAYLNYLDEPYNDRKNSIGRSVYRIISNYKGSNFERIARIIIDNGQVAELMGEPFVGYSRGITYWDTTMVPVYIAGSIKYLIQISQDVTEDINNRKLLAEQNRIMREQKNQLEAILEDMSDSLCILDKEGKYTILNKAARNMFFPSHSYMEKAGDGYPQAENFDSEGRRIPLRDIPSYRVLRGERFTAMRMNVKYPDRMMHLEVSGTPLYDGEGNFQAGILCSRDITSLVQKEMVILQKKEELLNAERKTREALEASIKLKDEFIYLISHEMRTPSAIVGSALQAIELMYSNELTPNIRKHLKTIKQNNNRQLRLINNLLDIARIKSGSIKLDMRDFDIVFLTKVIVQSVEIYSRQKEIEISFISELSRKTTFLDEEKYERILLNLLANAVKFTPRGKKIYVSLFAQRRKKRNMICISVTDEGIGIPIDKQAMIFERFGQVDSSLSRQAEGSGLGLTLVKMLVEAMDGEILLESEPDKGSTFIILLPVVKPAADTGNKLDGIQEQRVYNDDSRIVKAASIEFSDIYFD